MDQKLNNFEKKVVYVVGGSGLIGSSIVENFQNNGAKVINLDLIEKFKKKKNLTFVKFNIANVLSLEKNINKVVAKHGCPDVFINAAYPRTKNWKKSSYDNLTAQELKLNVDIHLNSFVWLSIKIAEIMKKNKVKGNLILLNSIYGKVGQDKKLYYKSKINPNPVYAAIKGGLISFIKNLSSYYGEYGLRANSIICGGIDGHIAGSKKKLSNNFKKKYSSKTLLGRMGTPTDISNAVLFLSSDKSSYITGTEMFVDGGYTCI